ncbi:MAG: cadherin domain-containing protein [Verrucomicrobia bacterium]|nr:cadherin domain-containing protein [Verrucomicrobiota bacterium]
MQTRWNLIGCIALSVASLCAQTLPDTLVLQVDADNNGTTDTMRLTKRSVRGPYLNYYRSLASGSYTSATPPQVRTFRGTIDGRPDMQVCAVVLPNGTLEYSGFDHILGRSHILKRSGANVSGQLAQAGPATPNPARPAGGLAEMPLGVDINYQQFAVVCAGSADLAWANLEHQVNIYDHFMARDADVAVALGTVLTREWGELYFPTGTGNHLDIVRNHWLDTPDLRNSPWEQIFTYATSTGLFGTGGYAWQKQLGKIDTIDRAQGAIGAQTLWHECGGHNWDAKHYAYGRDTMGGNQPHHGPWNIERVVALRDARRSDGSLLSPGQPYPDPVPPFTYVDQAITTVGLPIQIQPLANDRDSNGDSITIRDFTATTANGGTVTRSGETLTYIPSPGYIGKDIIAYTAQDNSPSALGARDLIFIEVMNHGPTLHYGFEENSGRIFANATGLGHPGRITTSDAQFLAVRAPVGSGLTLPADGLWCGTEKTLPDYTGVGAVYYPFDAEKMETGNHFDPMTGDFSFSLWFRAADVTSAHSLVRKFADGDARTGIRLRLESGRLNLALQALDGTKPYRSFNGSATILANQWYHAGVVINRSSQTAAIYLNGEGIGSMVLGAGESYFNGREPLKLGGDGPTGLLVDEFRLFTSAISATTLLAFYQAGDPTADGLPFTDTDGDGIASTTEATLGTQPAIADTDGDTFKDGLEWSSGSNPLDPSSTPHALFHGMHAWLTFDEPSGVLALDQSGNGRHGVLGGDAVRSSGQIGTAIGFDGVDDTVDLGTTASLTGTTDFTIGLWMRVPAGTATPMYLLAQREPGTTGHQGSYAVQMNTSGILNFFLYNSGYQFNLSTSVALNDGQWHHLTLQRGGSAGRIFVDGVLNVSGTGTVKSLTSHRVALGIDPRDGGRYFKGDVDDLRIYSRALTTTEIVALANRAPQTRNFNLSVTENQHAGSYVGNAITVDPDAGQTLSYRITAGNTDGAFSIDPSAGVITTTRPLDRETTRAYQLTVEAADDSENRRATACPVTVTVRDVPADDSDADGMHDEWELAWFGGPALSNPAADPDHDTQNNRMEFLTGSSPNDSSSVFRQTPSFNGVFSTQLAGLAGRRYVLERSANLAGGVWTEVAATGPLAADLPVTLADPDPAPPPAAFYRIAISLP